MPNIKPISDLRNYSEVLHDVTFGSPVFHLLKMEEDVRLIIDIQEYENIIATLTLMDELSKGRKSGEVEGWLSAEEVRSHFKKKQHEL